MDYNTFPSDTMTAERSSGNGHEISLKDRVMERAGDVAHKAQDVAETALSRVNEMDTSKKFAIAGVVAAVGLGIAGIVIARQLRKKSFEERAIGAAKRAARLTKKAANKAMDRLDRLEANHRNLYDLVSDSIPGVKRAHKLGKLFRT